MPLEGLTIQNAHRHGHSNEVTSLAFASDSETLASGGYDQAARLWNARTGAALGAFSGHNVGVSCIAWLPGSSKLLVGDHSHISLHDRNRIMLERKWPAHWGWLYSIAVSADGSWFMSTGLDRKLKYWNIEAEEPIFESGKFQQIAEALAWHPDRSMCAIATRSLLRTWDVEARNELRALRGHRKNVTTVAYSPDGRFLASGSEDRTIRLWDSRNGSEVAVLTGHAGWLRSIVFIPKSNTLIAGDSIGAIRFWDVESKTEVSEPVWYNNRDLGLRAVAVSPDARLLAAAGYGGAIQIWHLARENS